MLENIMNAPDLTSFPFGDLWEGQVEKKYSIIVITVMLLIKYIFTIIVNLQVCIRSRNLNMTKDLWDVRCNSQF